MIRIKKGLNLPIGGAPDQAISSGKALRHVALVGFDYPDMKPTMAVQEGDRVKLGQELFTDKKNPEVIYTSPASGVVKAINRGEKRVFQSIVIAVDGTEEVTFDKFPEAALASLGRDQVMANLVRSGMLTAFRTRPYSKVPAPDTVPHSIFVSVMDTNPLAADPAVVIKDASKAFQQGLLVIKALTTGKVFVVSRPGTAVEIPNDPLLVQEQFDGPHPAGNVGTHIHFLDPVSATKTVWHVGYQDVIAIGRLFITGRLDTSRVVAICGPRAKKPRLVRTQLGASLSELTHGELNEGPECRVISGSVFGGRTARGNADFLGRYATQVTLLTEGVQRDFMGWLSPGASRFSVMNIYLSKLLPSRLFNFTTNTNGSERAMVPIGTYEEVMPLDILPTQLLRSIIVGDTELSQTLGVLELDEEDLALCSFVCPGKYEYGPILRENLGRIEREG